MAEEPDVPGPEDRRTRALRRLWGALPAISLVILLVVIATLAVRCQDEKERLDEAKKREARRERPPVNVVVLDVKPRTVRDKLELPAVVEPWVELELLAEVHGKVIRVAVDEGDAVKKGDLIALIDPRDYENALASARADYDLARKTLTRYRNLREKDLIPQADLDEAQARAETLTAAVENAELRLERCRIRAPISGVVNRLDAKVGLLLAVSDPVGQVLDISRVKVSVGIPESDVDAVRELEAFDLVVDALGGKVLRGRRHFLARAPDTMAKLFRLEIAVDNPREELLPGMFVRARIVKEEAVESLAVPLYTVIARDDGRFVFVEDGGLARARLVETGILEGWLVEVTKGLSAGDRVVVVGQRSLEEGQTVNVTRTVADPEELFR
jgi:membrane fusion protein (multidrug efflux system)